MVFIRRFDELGRSDVDLAGGKGANLGELTKAGFPVPPGFVLTTAAYREYVAASGIDAKIQELAAGPETAETAAQIRLLFAATPVPQAMTRELLAALEQLGPGPVAVRSSATAEDLAEASFAGQQDTYLNVHADELLAAVRDCWASLWTERAMAYRARQGIPPADVALAVVVQRMVAADAAGVLFTANPTNGRRGEAVVSAAWGLGEAVVSGAVTTDDVVVDTAGGRVLGRTTAAKDVMTVALESGTAERPVPAEQRSRSVLDDAAAAALAAIGARIEGHFGAPQDIEWARAGSEFWIVQARPITALPEPVGDAPTDWTVPDPSSYYMRASIVEQLPDPLTPLFAELAEGSVGRTVRALMRQLMGVGVVHDDEVGFPTVNGYAYYRYGRAALMRFGVRGLSAVRALGRNDLPAGPKHWRDHAHPEYAATVDAWRERALGELTAAQLLDGVTELLDAGTAYYTSVQSIIPLAAGSELTFTQFYDRAVRRAGDPPAATFLLGFASAPIRAERSLYELARWVRAQDGLTIDDPAGVDPAVWAEWQERFRRHLELFGHAIYNLDFANAVPADDPAPLLDTLRFYLDGGGTDPVERMGRSAERRDAATAEIAARLDPARRAVFDRLLRWAQESAPLREDALADIGLAWPQIRKMIRVLGERAVADGKIAQVDDVFWLRSTEILARPGLAFGEVVAARKTVWRGQRLVTPPQLLPKGVSWEKFEFLFPAGSGEQTGNVLKGTGASSGQVSATARVLGGPADFGRMQPGDVLVASITTPAWTPLFAMASAVVTDVGGPLSHSSIVAREYGIPAVLGTGVATRRIVDGERIRVDGDAGTVTLLDAPAQPQAPAVAKKGRAPAIVAAAAGAALLVVLRRRRRRSAEPT